ncbi:hypothetical protein ACS3SW_18600 [Roseobacteraceae bacterium S113]
MTEHQTIPQDPLRPATHVMRLSQMGAMFPTRLSFLRSILRRLVAERAVLARPVWNIDADGYGHGVYTIPLGGHAYSLVAISQPLDPEDRTDRVIATAWDAAFVLYDGVPDASEIARIAAQAPKQEAGRFSARDLVLSRANKSVRLWAELLETLRAGRQPDPSRLNDVGYLMRTTAVYGNGKFGIADRRLFAERPGLEGPFAAEMLTVWLIRAFTHDLLDHVAGTPLDPALKRHLGIGNATGLGMAPFLVNHPVLLHNWMISRETAIARVCAVEEMDGAQIDTVLALKARVPAHIAQWRLSEAEPRATRDALERDMTRFLDQEALWSRDALGKPFAIRRIAQAAARLGADVEELTLALLLEPFGPLIDGLTECMADPLGSLAPPIETTHALRLAIESHCGWALSPDYAASGECQRFWYVSEEKLEPRLGNRHIEMGAERESPLDIARRIKALYAALPDDDISTIALLEQAPEHLLAVERVQIAVTYPYADIQNNLIAATCRPIDMLRAKLAMFGATKFDPKSDLWTRVTLAQGAPLPQDVAKGDEEDWWLVAMPEPAVAAP